MGHPKGKIRIGALIGALLVVWLSQSFAAAGEEVATSGSPDASLLWCCKLPTGEAYSTITLGADGAIYVLAVDAIAGESAFIHAVSSDGNLMWEYHAGNVEFLAVSANNRLYCGRELGSGGGGVLTCLNPDGTVRWEYATNCQLNAAPTFGADGSVYLPAARVERDTYDVLGGRLFAISGQGVLQWTFDTDGKLVDSPLLQQGGTTIIIRDRRDLYVLRSNGSVLWKWQFPGEYGYATEVSPGGNVYCGVALAETEDGYTMETGYVYSLRPDGTMTWRTALEGSAVYPESIDFLPGRYLLVMSGDMSGDGTDFWAFTPDDGSLLWHIGAPYVGSVSLGRDGSLYYGSGEVGWSFFRRLSRIAPDGQVAWTFEPEAESHESWLHVSDSDQAIIVALDRIDREHLKQVYGRGNPVVIGSSLLEISVEGQLLWRYDMESTITGMAVQETGQDETVIYVTTDDGYLYAFGA